MMELKMTRLAGIASFFAFCVILLGAYTRLTDAGLGCPDWPGCYGHAVVPHSLDATPYAGQALFHLKAWTEMVHRYLAGTLGLLIITLAFGVVKSRGMSKKLPLSLVGLLVFQALLGMWTVTLKLHPTIVMLHLIGGFTTLSCLWAYFFRYTFLNQFQCNDSDFATHFKSYARIGLLVLITQIFLGGWTSANYAAIVCPDFPYCHGTLLPNLFFQKAFNIFQPIGPNFSGGIFDYDIRVTIHMIHRFGALLTTLVLGSLSLMVFFKAKNRLLKQNSLVVLGLLGTQVMLGILNVVKFLPLGIAVAHNGVAALLLLATLSLNLSLSAAAQEK